MLIESPGPLPPTLHIPVHLIKEIKFAAAHQLDHHDGKCKNRHGHTYVLQVEISGPVQPVDGKPESGMVFDFGRLGRTLKRLHDLCLDHKDLGDFDPYPTAERLVLRIAYLLLLDLSPELADVGATLSSVKLFEEHTFPACSAEVRAPTLALLPGAFFPDTKLCRAADWARSRAGDPAILASLPEGSDEAAA